MCCVVQRTCIMYIAAARMGSTPIVAGISFVDLSRWRIAKDTLAGACPDDGFLSRIQYIKNSACWGWLAPDILLYLPHKNLCEFLHVLLVGIN